MSEKFKERISTAKKGRELWLSLVEQYQIENSHYVIVLPSCGAIYNEPAIQELPRFLKKRGIKKAFVLTSDDNVLNRKIAYDEIEVVFVEMLMSDLKALVQFYNLYEFSPNVIIGSLEEPSGRMGKQLIGKKNLSSEEVFAGIVYSLVD